MFQIILSVLCSWAFYGSLGAIVLMLGVIIKLLRSGDLTDHKLVVFLITVTGPLAMVLIALLFWSIGFTFGHGIWPWFN